MNIFYVDEDPERAARDLPDKLLIKMPLESAQLLCSALYHFDGKWQIPYKPTHMRHPSTIWTTERRANFQWLCNHGKSLCQVYTEVYGKRHKCLDVIEFCEKISFKRSYILRTWYDEFQAPPQCMPDKYKQKDTVQAYRNYMLNEKAHYAKWKSRPKPAWWNI